MNTPLSPLVGHWLKKIKLAWDVKQEDFGQDAEEAMRFFDGPYDWLYNRATIARSRGFVYGGDEASAPRPTFGMTVNKVAEMVQLFGPALYHRNPVRQVNPRAPVMIPPELFGATNPDPMAQQAAMQQQLMMVQRQQANHAIDVARAQLLELYLNYTPTALNLKEEARWAIDEAIIKGCGTLWTELYVPPGAGSKMVGSFYDSVDNLIVDTDMESMRDAKWIAKKCVHPVWQVEQDYNLEPGTLKGHLESHDQQAMIGADNMLDYERKKGLSNDLVVYYKIYSKMGLGGRLSGIDQSLREPLEALGNFTYLVVCDKCDFPLNVPRALQESGDVVALQQAVQWPTPFWADDAWPVTVFAFHSRPRKVWPMSHLKPGMGELKFLNWMYSFIAGKIRTACRDFLVMKKSLGEEVKEVILHGEDYELVQIEEQTGAISDVVAFLQHPQFNGDIWKVIEAIENNFEKRVGLTELMYGMSSTQLRSAAEAQTKSSQMQIRPDDMAEKIETAMTFCARREALAARWHLTGQDVNGVLGPVGASLWDQLLTASDPADVLFQLEYRIEAGSIRKPNRDRDVANANLAMQTVFTPLFQYGMQTGNVGPVNQVLTQWGRANEIAEVSKLLLQPPPPPPPMPGVPGAPAGPPPAQPGAKP